MRTYLWMKTLIWGHELLKTLHSVPLKKWCVSCWGDSVAMVWSTQWERAGNHFVSMFKGTIKSANVLHRTKTFFTSWHRAISRSYFSGSSHCNIYVNCASPTKVRHLNLWNVSWIIEEFVMFFSKHLVWGQSFAVKFISSNWHNNKGSQGTVTLALKYGNIVYRDVKPMT